MGKRMLQKCKRTVACILATVTCISLFSGAGSIDNAEAAEPSGQSFATGTIQNTEIELSAETVIEDNVSFTIYGDPDKEYRIEGTLYDADTKEPILLDGKEISSHADIVYEETGTDAAADTDENGTDTEETNTDKLTNGYMQGDTTLTFTFDGTGIGSEKAVVSLAIYENGEDLFSSDLNNDSENQVITFRNPGGLGTLNSQTENNPNARFIPAPGAPVINVTAVDTDGNTLPAIFFEIQYLVNGDRVASGTTGSDGTVSMSFETSPNGLYMVNPVNSGDYRIVGSPFQCITVETGLGQTYDLTFTFEERESPDTVEIVFWAVDTNGNPLPGLGYSLNRVSSSIYDTVETDSNGTIVFKNLSTTGRDHNDAYNVSEEEIPDYCNYICGTFDDSNVLPTQTSDCFYAQCIYEVTDVTSSWTAEFSPVGISTYTGNGILLPGGIANVYSYQSSDPNSLLLIGGQIVAGEPTGNGLILNYSDSYDGRYAISTPILPATQQQVNYTCTETGPYRYYKITADGVLTQYTDDTFTEAMPETNLTYMFDPTVLNLTLHTQAGSENAGPLEGVKFEITLRDSLGDPIMVRTVTSNSDGEVIVPINIEDLRNVDTYDIWAEEMGRPNGYYLSQINPYDSPGNPVQIGTITLERIGCSITGNNTEWIYNPLTAHMVITLRGQDPTGVDSGALSGSFEVATLEEMVLGEYWIISIHLARTTLDIA